jgi:enoyl-CoA hydratase/carnithine racemase
VVRAIDAGIAAAMAADDCRAIVLTGAGEQAFCAGADLQKNAKGGAFDADFAHPRHYIVDLFKRMQECALPIVARVNGHAMAGGFGLLCACDMAVAADDIRIGTPEAKVGVTPMMILPFMLRVLPPRKLQEMCVTAEQFGAAEALEWGVVNYVVPRKELDGRVDWLLSRILDKSPTAIRLGKQAYSAMRDMSLRESLEYAQAMVPVMSSTEDVREGMAAFQEKRAPKWTGR